jgi:hypothetical protein
MTESVLKNQPDHKWEMMLPELGKDSPLFTLLRVDPQTNATTLMIEFPTALHIPKHTHDKERDAFYYPWVAPFREQRHG